MLLFPNAGAGGGLLTVVRGASSVIKIKHKSTN